MRTSPWRKPGRGSRPPRWAEALIAASLEPDVREFALGDLAQEYEERRRRKGWIRAAVWYWWEAARTALGGGRGGQGRGGVSEGDPPRRRRRGFADAVSRDVRHALRSFARAPGFTLAAVTTLALGIGATTAVYSLADAVLFRPLAGVEDLEDVAIAQPCAPATARDSCLNLGLTYPNLRDIVPRLQLVSGLAGYAGVAGWAEVVAGDGAPRNMDPLYVTASFFEVLGARPLLGRTFTEQEDDPSGGAPVVVISHRLWKAVFNQAPDVLGRDLRINGHRLTVIGVMPRRFGAIEGRRHDLWLPGSTMHWINRWSLDFGDRGSGRDWGEFVVRRRQGVSWDQVKAELDSFNVWLAEQYPSDNAHLESVRFRIYPDLAERGPRLAGVFVALFATVGLILLIACANVAGLLVIRGLGRRGEVAVRKALGASRWRVLCHYLTESMLLWLVGGAGGVLLTYALVRVAEWRSPLSDLEFSMDPRVLAFTALVSIAVGLTFGALPALGAARVDAAKWLGQAVPAASGGRRWVRATLSVLQLAAMLTLLVGALLMARTVKSLYDVDLGFEPADVMVFDVSLGEERFEDVSRLQYMREMTGRLRADRRVVAASTAMMVPARDVAFTTSVRVVDDASGVEQARATFVGAEFFDVLRIPIVAGRGFTDEEVVSSVPSEAVVLSEFLARRLFAEDNPLGRLVQFPGGRYPDRLYRVVGIAGDVRFSPSSMTRGVDPMAYRPFAADGSVPSSATFIVRARPGGEDAARLVRSMAATLDADLPVTGLQSLRDLVARFYSGAVLIASLTAAMSLLAAFLAAMGLYGVVGVAAAERMREFGIRIALGADGRAMVKLVGGEALSIVLPGVITGLLGAFALGVVIEGFLYGVSPLDPLSWTLATLLLAVVVTIAVVAPVRRATRAEPVDILRAT